MSEYHEINSYLQRPGSITKQSFILKDITTSKSASNFELNRLLELLSITNGVDMQLKLFSALSAYLMFNKGANIDVIIKCNAVYDKIHNVLSRCLPRKSTEALNFLSALLYIDTEEDITTKKTTLSLYARNMTRVSGCLSTMCEMFSNCMMYHDTWKALCQCVAIACSGCEMNQSYCSHLIPVCIQKCSQVNIDILMILQSLLMNHARNVQLFFDCKGVFIFTRELLHYDKCLQLLTTLVQYSKIATLLQQTNVIADLRDFLRLYGPNSQLGQKAIIILNQISPSAKGKEIRQNVLTSENVTHANKPNIDEIDTTINKSPKNDVNANTENDFEETNVLIQNVMKEIYKWKANELINIKKSDLVLDPVNRSRQPIAAKKQVLACKRKPVKNNITKIRAAKKLNKTKNVMHKSAGNRLHSNIATELSFSFLQNDDFKVPKNKQPIQNMYKGDTQQDLQDIEDTPSDVTTSTETLLDTKKCVKPTVTIQDFKPMFASTPKHTQGSVKNNTEATVNMSKSSKQNKLKKLKMKRQKAKKERQYEKGMKNSSLGARFFGAINDSCTTFVKTVKNIFRKKESPDISQSSTSNTRENFSVKNKRHSTNSFGNYMRKRDAVLNNIWIKNYSSGFSTDANSCKTCDNTEVLKHKLTKDEFLKETVKKLKLGINLYGCDFKKISKTMWPRETYMTPLVLYNLYRKLLLK